MATHTAWVLSRRIFVLARISSILLIITILHSSNHQTSVRCQDFEDLNNNNNNNHNNNKQALDNASQFVQQQSLPQGAAFQPSRQFGAQPALSAPSNSRQSFQRPVLSSRFAQQHQQLSSQASTVTNTVVSGQQQTLPTTPGQQPQQVAQSVAASSNIEQIMKSALARTSRLEQTSGLSAESRQDQTSEPIQSRSGPQAQTPAAAAAQISAAAPSASTGSRDRSSPAADSSEAQASTQQAEEQQTTGAVQPGAVANHETVYSDQRFANLFARRNNQKKSKFTPTEQIKAKPTLPSFIKSPPDPKQFNANSGESQDSRPIPQASANIISARLQQQQANQGRQSVSQKKPNAAITSNTAAAANNKRLNSQKQTGSGPTSAAAKGPSASRAGGPLSAAANVNNKPNANNPFNKSQQSNSDPANVIAMARRRLLANNAAQQRPATN